MKPSAVFYLFPDKNLTYYKSTANLKKDNV